MEMQATTAQHQPSREVLTRQQKHTPSASSAGSSRRTSTECSAWRCAPLTAAAARMPELHTEMCRNRDARRLRFDTRMQDLWETREKPKPLHLAEIVGDEQPALQNGSLGGEHAPAAGESACKALGIAGAHRVWSPAESAKVAAQCPPAYAADVHHDVHHAHQCCVMSISVQRAAC